MKAISLVLLSLFFVGAQAAETGSNGSEQLHQAPGETFELTPTLGLQDNSIKFNPSGSIEQSGPVIQVKAEYGFNQTLSAGVLLGYEALSGKASAGSISGDEKGLRDPSVFLNARFDLGASAIRLGGTFAFSVEKEKIDSNLNSNPATGGLHLEPYVGYEMYFGQNTVGARVAYNFQLSDRKYTDSSSGSDVDRTVSGGAQFKGTLFYELAMNPATIGFAFDLMNVAKSTYKTDSTGTNNDSSGNSNWALNFYVPVQAAPNIVLLPKFQYGQYSAFDTSTYSSITQWSLEFGARITF